METAPESELQVSQLAEAIHRARNDLATIASMLQLQAKMSNNKAVSEALMAANHRVIAISRVNQAIDAATLTEPTINAKGFLDGIIGNLQAVVQGRPIEIKAIAGLPVRLPLNYARPLGLAMNEWVTNALKYAFPGQRSGTVSIGLAVQDQVCILTVRDDGIGFGAAAKPHGTGLGTRLARGLARQLKGEVSIEVGAEGGCICTMNFPLP